ncbi:MFS transporter [Virgibacillus pantothenticus]|uniref:MFS transporter n=1 Tax=Virgibacillus pantothenticus TaxID=1473 RepID=UPI0009546043|nr:MFS transporter [Virgibacillus pantothenticus]MED3735643.1 MFS transporter [Virgibacillus pantothenticus]QTY15721.1 MFS transporter [Virgibacillus pantothenticus]SIS96053.1 hypothetical protein SAMN05421787_10834 [Virgibacillus pantothenticus]
MNYRLLILVLGTFIVGTDNFVIAGLLPHIADDMSVTIAAAGNWLCICHSLCCRGTSL